MRIPYKSETGRGPRAESSPNCGLRVAGCGFAAEDESPSPFTVARRRPVGRARIRHSRPAARNAFARRALLVVVALLAFPVVSLADHLRLADGTTIEVEEAWEDAQGIWYRRGGVTHLVERSRVKAIVRGDEAAKSAPEIVTAAKPDATAEGQTAEESETVWIHLVGGAKVEVDEASETAEGVWYKRGNVSVFLERARVERVERERLTPEVAAEIGEKRGRRRERRWTTGSARLDAIIRQNGARHGVDPYLVFCVMEQESRFNSRAVSPAGARGLMQLMPGTAARFGVRNSFDPAQNVAGGTRYLKELLRRFNNRVDLVLAGYNAGEGNVIRFGHRVPPFRETRNYVRRITAKYREQ
jgi:Zn-finger nucleic acid-binding protein